MAARLSLRRRASAYLIYARFASRNGPFVGRVSAKP
jgi:hypothetical protein